MTLTIKNSPELNSSGQPGTPSQNSEANSGGQSQRSNPVCLEVSVTLRSLPGQPGGSGQPLSDQGKTVIVFENGAVLRITNNLPIGQTVILTNPSGREVVCRAVSGRKLPSVKGYVEVEFVEPAKDFWGLHQNQNIAPVATAPQPVTPPAPHETPAPPLPPPAIAPPEAPAKPARASLGRGPSFEDIPGLLSMPASNAERESKTQPSRPAPENPEKTAKGGSDYYHSENAQSTSVANWRQQDSEPPIEKRASRATRNASSTKSRSSAPARNFMGQGLMGYEQPGSSSTSSGGRTPIIIGMAALILAGICAAVFFLRQGAAGISIAKTDALSQPSAMALSPAAKSAPAPGRKQHEESAQVTGQTQAQPNSQVQPVAVDQPQSIPALAAVPAVVTSPASTDSRTASANVRRQEENSTTTKQPNPASSRRPAIPNLKMSSPNAPARNAGSLGQGAVPVTEIASTDAVGGIPSAGLLTSAGKTFNPPAPPPSAPAPPPVLAPAQASRIVRDPKLISSARLVYPTTARQTHIEGSVTVSASIDEHGKVVGAKALSGPMVLRQAAVDSVIQWKYSPGLEDGKAVPSQVTVTVEFRLN